MVLSVRAAGAADLAAIQSIAAASPGAAQWTPAQWESLFRKDSSRIVLVAVETQAASPQILGFLVAASGAAGEWELENMAVAAAARRRGIGAELIGELVRTAEKRDARAIHLEVRAANQAARGLYERSGFRQVGVRPRYYSCPTDDAVLYTRELAPEPSKTG